MPKPTLVDREANITALIYFQGQAPATGRDTQEIVLEVCRDEGLQRVIWFSRILTDPERSDLYEMILAEGIRRHGKPQPGPYLRSLVWPTGVMLGIRTAVGWGEQIVMVSEGGGFARCSEHHRQQAGHPASDHVAELFGSASHRPAGAP
ncbi:threonyl-trna synthetase [Methylobacterium sp. ID0610]|uniref:threonyl-trna synthetase n=1 Tax=Methylobacterium carpenticola TaxID=3344827 RepID=UPI0036ABD142